MRVSARMLAWSEWQRPLNLRSVNLKNKRIYMAAFINLHRAQPGCTETRSGNCSTTVVYEHSFVTPNAHCTAPMALRERFGEFINVGRNSFN